MEPRQVVLVDTNIIIEAVRTRCWNALVGRFTLETVDKCLEEARTGDPMRRAYVAVDTEKLKGVSMAHNVSAVEKARLAVALPTADQLDAGERELFAHALGRTDDWIAGCADRAALKAAFALGWQDRIMSLEALAHVAGARPELKRHFRERWLSDVRMTLVAMRRPNVNCLVAVDATTRHSMKPGLSGKAVKPSQPYRIADGRHE